MRRRDKRTRDAFTLIEVMTSTFIAMYIFLGAWAIYMMVWGWWHEMAPRIEAERIARTALSSVVDGFVDASAGTYSVGSALFSRRNGLAWAKGIDDIPAGQSAQSVNFALEPDAGNVRVFSLNLDAVSGLNAVYYTDSSGLTRMLKGTLGITDLRFEKFQAADGSYLDNVIRVTAAVTKNITGTRKDVYPVTVTYSEVVFLRNLP